MSQPFSAGSIVPPDAVNISQNSANTPNLVAFEAGFTGFYNLQAINVESVEWQFTTTGSGPTGHWPDGTMRGSFIRTGSTTTYQLASGTVAARCRIYDTFNARFTEWVHSALVTYTAPAFDPIGSAASAQAAAEANAASLYLTGLTGDGVATGPGNASFTLATVNSSPGSVGSAANTLTATVNAKGLITTLAQTAISITSAAISNFSSAVNTLIAAATLSAVQITSGILALAQGGTDANLSATGGAGQYLKQTTNGGAVTVAVIAASDLPVTTVTPGPYTNANVTFDQYGRATAASNGTGSGSSSPLFNFTHF